MGHRDSLGFADWVGRGAGEVVVVPQATLSPVEVAVLIQVVWEVQGSRLGPGSIRGPDPVPSQRPVGDGSSYITWKVV